jgi:hypothetical protein
MTLEETAIFYTSRENSAYTLCKAVPCRNDSIVFNYLLLSLNIDQKWLHIAKKIKVDTF